MHKLRERKGGKTVYSDQEFAIKYSSEVVLKHLLGNNYDSMIKVFRKGIRKGVFLN